MCFKYAWYPLDEITLKLSESSDDEILLGDSNSNEQLKLKMTFSVVEFNELHHDVNYKRDTKSQTYYLTRAYSILKPGMTSNIVHSCFWEQIKIACSILHKRAKIYQSGILLL